MFGLSFQFVSTATRSTEPKPPKKCRNIVILACRNEEEDKWYKSLMYRIYKPRPGWFWYWIVIGIKTFRNQISKSRFLLSFLITFIALPYYKRLVCDQEVYYSGTLVVEGGIFLSTYQMARLKIHLCCFYCCCYGKLNRRTKAHNDSPNGFSFPLFMFDLRSASKNFEVLAVTRC